MLKDHKLKEEILTDIEKEEEDLCSEDIKDFTHEVS